MKILVTGANGLLSTSFLKTLPSDAEVTAVVHHIATADLPVDATLLEADLSLADFIDGSWPTELDAVVHLAYAPASPNYESEQEAFAVNTAATLKLIQYAIEAGASQFVFASSGSVYAESDHQVTEDTAPNPSDFYGATKLAGEILISRFTDKINVQLLRLFNLYGPDAQHGIVSQLTSRILNDQRVTVAGGTGMRTTPTYIDDAGTVLYRSLELSGSNTINVAGPESIDVRELATLIGEMLNRTVKFESTAAPAIMSRMGTSLRSRQLINFSPDTTLEAGLTRTLKRANTTTSRDESKDQ